MPNKLALFAIVQLVIVCLAKAENIDGCKGQICQESGACCPCPDWVCCQHISPTTPTCMQAESECPVPTYYDTKKKKMDIEETRGSKLTTCCPGPICNGCCCPSAGYVCCPDGDSCAKTLDACAGVSQHKQHHYLDVVKLIKIS